MCSRQATSGQAAARTGKWYPPRGPAPPFQGSSAAGQPSWLQTGQTTKLALLHFKGALFTPTPKQASRSQSATFRLSFQRPTRAAVSRALAAANQLPAGMHTTWHSPAAHTVRLAHAVVPAVGAALLVAQHVHRQKHDSDTDLAHRLLDGTEEVRRLLDTAPFRLSRLVHDARTVLSARPTWRQPPSTPSGLTARQRLA